MSIPGITFISGSVILSEIGDSRVFQTPDNWQMVWPQSRGEWISGKRGNAESRNVVPGLSELYLSRLPRPWLI